MVDAYVHRASGRRALLLCIFMQARKGRAMMRVSNLCLNISSRPWKKQLPTLEDGEN